MLSSCTSEKFNSTSVARQQKQPLFFSPATIQPKLTVNPPNDIYEQEADAMAEKVAGTSAGAPTFFSPAHSSAGIQRKCQHCEEEEKMQRKEGTSSSPAISAGTASYVNSLSTKGAPLPSQSMSFFGQQFGHDFSTVKIHTDGDAAQSAQSVNAHAYTVGNNIVFNTNQFAPETKSGKRLLAHELTHVVQQRSGRTGMLQRDHVADTGFRYTPPSTVTRTIAEIQAIVNVNPDGVYGENTRKAVEKYQGKLKAAGLYTDTIDGKWGKNTDDAHIAFATGTARTGYNCAGFAFKKYTWIDLIPTKAIYATMTKLADCSKTCNPHDYKFWMWEVDMATIQKSTGLKTLPHRDFHTVGGQTNSKGEGPATVMSKDGARPVVGPKPPMDWKLKSGPADGFDGNPDPNFDWEITNVVESCYCSSTLP